MTRKYTNILLAFYVKICSQSFRATPAATTLLIYIFKLKTDSGPHKRLLR